MNRPAGSQPGTGHAATNTWIEAASAPPPLAARSFGPETSANGENAVQRIVWHFWFAACFYLLTVLLYGACQCLQALATITGCSTAAAGLWPAAPTPGCIAGWIVGVQHWMATALTPLLHLEERMVTPDQLAAMVEPAVVAALLYLAGLAIARRAANRVAPRSITLAAALHARLRPRQPGLAG
jgi:hypothetical protein